MRPDLPKRLSLLGLAWLVVGCNGPGCSSLGPLPAGFPAASRVPNAAQLRLSATGIAKLESEPALFGAQLLEGSLEVEVPSSCGGSPATCCTGGTPVSPCGPIVFDLEALPGDAPRLEFTPVQGASRIDVTLRARLATATDVPVNVAVFGDCGQDVRIDLPLAFVQDAMAGTTHLVPGRNRGYITADRCVLCPSTTSEPPT